MPELPDNTVYLEALERGGGSGEPLRWCGINSPFLLRTFDPPLEAVEGKVVRSLRRLGKRIAMGLDEDLWIVLHLMIAGRLHWKSPGANLAGKYNLAAFDFASGTLMLTEAGAKRRAALYIVRGKDVWTGTTRRTRRVDCGHAKEFAAVFAIPQSVRSNERHRSHAVQRYRQCVFRRNLCRAHARHSRADAEVTERRCRTTIRGHAPRSWWNGPIEAA